MAIHAVGSLEYLLDKYGDIFTDKLGTIKAHCAMLHVKQGEKPKFFKAQSVPYAVKGAIASWKESPTVSGQPR